MGVPRCSPWPEQQWLLSSGPSTAEQLDGRAMHTEPAESPACRAASSCCP